MDHSDEREQFLKLIQRHSGNAAAIARALTKGGDKITRQAVSQRIYRLGLLEDADICRKLGGVNGKRIDLDPEGERSNLMAELVRGPDRDAAAKRLGMSRRNLYRKMKQYGITKSVIAGVGE